MGHVPHFYTRSFNTVGSKLECAFVKFSQVCENALYASARERVNLINRFSLSHYDTVKRAKWQQGKTPGIGR